MNEQVLVNKKLFLGICLGLQFLAKHSLELGTYEGLGWIDGTVQKIAPNEEKFRIPHIGWNDLQFNGNCQLFDNLESEATFYFVHSYHLVAENQDTNAVVATCWHGQTVTAAVHKDNIYGVQFHPEKSQKSGLELLRNFVKVI